MNNKNYYTNLPDNKSKLYGGAYGVHDSDLVELRNQSLVEFSQINSASADVAENIKKEFLSNYKDWLFSPFQFEKTDLLQYACFTQGTTESFAQFYIRYRNNHRLRIAKGEYFYHQMMKSLWYKEQFAWLDEDKIRTGDVVLISFPFADTGDIYPNMDLLLDECDSNNVPVMLDLAYLNLTTGKELPYCLDFSRPCIKYVVSSLSKAFPVETFRIGIRLQKEKMEDQIYVVNEENYNYINLCSAYIGNRLINEFAPDFIFNRYKAQQEQLCQQLNLQPSPCFNFGIDYNQKYNQYNRGNATNRLCFSRIWDGRAETEGLTE